MGEACGIRDGTLVTSSNNAAAVSVDHDGSVSYEGQGKARFFSLPAVVKTGRKEIIRD